MNAMRSAYDPRPSPQRAAVHRNAAETLAALPPGASGTVREVEEPLRRRLYELGLLPGTRVICLYVSPMGDPKAYRIRGVVLGIRARDAAAVRLDPDGGTP